MSVKVSLKNLLLAVLVIAIFHIFSLLTSLAISVYLIVGVYLGNAFWRANALGINPEGAMILAILTTLTPVPTGILYAILDDPYRNQLKKDAMLLIDNRIYHITFKNKNDSR